MIDYKFFRNLISHAFNDENIDFDDIPDASIYKQREKEEYVRPLISVTEKVPETGKPDSPFFLSDEDREKVENWEIRKKDIFKDKDRYYYFCEFVDRYVDMHGLRGVKDRNVRLLAELSGACGPDVENRIIWALVENNRPLAMKEAMYQYSYSDWSKEDIQDAYQDCLVELAETYRRRLDEIRNMTIMEFQRLNFFTCKNACNTFDRRLGHARLDDSCEEMVPLDEEDERLYAQPETFLNMDVEFFLGELDFLTRREIYIISAYLFGDEVNGIIGIENNTMVIEDIAEVVELTRERTRQIIKKAFRKIKAYADKNKLKYTFFTVDAEYERNIEKRQKLTYYAIQY